MAALPMITATSPAANPESTEVAPARHLKVASVLQLSARGQKMVSNPPTTDELSVWPVPHM